MANERTQAPGAPGIPARWTSSAKVGVGKALNASSDVSFTISHGILNEVYYPWEDLACIRDMELVVTDGKDFFSEEKKHTDHTVKMAADGVPAYKLTNTCKEQRYRIEKETLCDTIRNTLLQRTKFRPLKGKMEDYHVYVILAPHLGNQGGGNTGWVENYKGVPMLFARQGDLALALACSSPFKKRSVGFVGHSDGCQDLMQHKQMTWEYQEAKNGNVALTAEINLEATGGTFVISVGFGHNEEEAAHYARASILDGFEEAKESYVGEWKKWQKTLTRQRSSHNTIGKLFRNSATVLRVHEAKRMPGGIIASLSIPWGDARGDDDIGGYHLVWPRDLVESSGGLLALDAKEDTLRILTYLMATQEADGHWAQNMWVEGEPHWKGIQMDQTALPVLLIDLCRHHGALKPERLHRYWHTVKKALSFIVQYGPYTEQDRWERDAGLSPFTLAAEIAALLVGADFADANGEPGIAQYCRETADCWNDNIERWTYVTGTSLAKKVGVDGYYIRINPSGLTAAGLEGHYFHVKNQPEEKSKILLNELISPDTLALVRFGLRAPDDPRILNTIRVIDDQLKVDTPYGPCWHRYTNDGYGEHEDGSPYDGTGIGRAWPLLTGERAHYEIAAGNFEKAKALSKAMEAFANNGLIPEQIWDTEDIPEKELYFGKHSNSAMPLVWAHAEYIKLSHSLKKKKVFDMPEQTRERYLKDRTPSTLEIWRFEHPFDKLKAGQTLRIECNKAALIHWSDDGWKNSQDLPAHNTGLGLYYADIPVAHAQKGSVLFTFYWQEARKWENRNFEISIED